MQPRTRHLLASAAVLTVTTGTAACSAELDEDGANVEVEDVNDEDDGS